MVCVSEKKNKQKKCQVGYKRSSKETQKQTRPLKSGEKKIPTGDDAQRGALSHQWGWSGVLFLLARRKKETPSLFLHRDGRRFSCCLSGLAIVCFFFKRHTRSHLKIRLKGHSCEAVKEALKATDPLPCRPREGGGEEGEVSIVKWHSTRHASGRARKRNLRSRFR